MKSLNFWQNGPGAQSVLFPAARPWSLLECQLHHAIFVRSGRHESLCDCQSRRRRWLFRVADPQPATGLPFNSHRMLTAFGESSIINDLVLDLAQIEQSRQRLLTNHTQERTVIRSSPTFCYVKQSAYLLPIFFWWEQVPFSIAAGGKQREVWG